MPDRDEKIRFYPDGPGAHRDFQFHHTRRTGARMLLLAGTRSGCGKSTVMLALLAAFRRKGLSVQPFKAGPDFIDAGLHALISGRTSRNLDLYMCGKDYVSESVARHSQEADSVLIEGVMGLFDGGRRSSASLAGTLNAGVILVIDAYGMAESAGAIAKGFNDQLKAENGKCLSGIIFNRVSSERHYERLKDAIKGITEPLGYLPREAAFAIPERHLGLTIAEEGPLKEEQIYLLADAALNFIQIERVIELAKKKETAPVTNGFVSNLSFPLVGNPSEERLRTSRSDKSVKTSLKIAVARDRAFSFYYEDNFDILRENGAEIVFFSPLNEKELPAGIDCVYLGGGYPELHAKELSDNKEMLSLIRDWIESGNPLYAECGGFLYLSEALHIDEKNYRMCGIFPLTGTMRKCPVLGYREINIPEIPPLKGLSFRGHEFHYSVLSLNGEKEGIVYNLLCDSANGTISSALYKRALASYVHLHLGSNRDSTTRILRLIREGL